MSIEELKQKMDELLEANNKIIEFLQNRQTFLNAAMDKLNNLSNNDDTNALLMELIENLQRQITEFNDLNNYYEEQFETLRSKYVSRIAESII